MGWGSEAWALGSIGYMGYIRSVQGFKRLSTPNPVLIQYMEVDLMMCRVLGTLNNQKDAIRSQSVPSVRVGTWSLNVCP